MTLVFEVGSFSTLVELALFTRLPAASRAFSRAARTDPGILVPNVGEDSRRVAVLWGRMSRSSVPSKRCAFPGVRDG